MSLRITRMPPLIMLRRVDALVEIEAILRRSSTKSKRKKMGAAPLLTSEWRLRLSPEVGEGMGATTLAVKQREGRHGGTTPGMLVRMI